MVAFGMLLKVALLLCRVEETRTQETRRNMVGLPAVSVRSIGHEDRPQKLARVCVVHPTARFDSLYAPIASVVLLLVDPCLHVCPALVALNGCPGFIVGTSFVGHMCIVIAQSGSIKLSHFCGRIITPDGPIRS